MLRKIEKGNKSAFFLPMFRIATDKDSDRTDSVLLTVFGMAPGSGGMEKEKRTIGMRAGRCVSRRPDGEHGR